MENRPDPLLLLLLLALPVFVIYLGANSIWDANEAFYVETPRQMVLTGDYVNPSFNGQPRFNKPVLSYWIVAGLYHLLGATVTAERIGIALGALGLIGATWLIGRALGTARTGVLAALLVASSPRVVMHARRIFIDVYITCFLAIALACFVQALRAPAHKRRWLIGMYVALGLAVLTKGPAFLVLVGVICLIWLVLEGRLADVRRLMLVPGLLIVAAIVLPWYLEVYRQHGWTYITSFVFGENVGRFTNAMTPDGRRLWFFLPVLLTDLFPWAPLIVLPLATAWRRAQPSEPAAHASIRRLLWCWIIVIVGAFSVSQTKEDLYIFPVVPAVAALVADFLITRGYGATSRTVRYLIGAVAAACLLLAAAGQYLLSDGYFALPHVPFASVAIATAALVSLICVWTGRGALAIGALAAGFVAFNYIFVARILPDFERLKPAPTFAGAFVGQHAPGALFAHFGMSLPSLVYYLNQPVEEIGSFAQAEAFFRDASDERWLLLRAADWDRLRGRASQPEAHIGALCIKASHPALEATFDDVVRGTPPPDVVLISNRCR